MSMAINPEQPLELRDAMGGMVGLVVNAETQRALMAQRDALQKQVAELQGELARARKERDELKAERDEYAHAWEVVSQDKSLLFDQKELASMRAEGVSLDTILRDLEEMMRSQ